MCIAVGKLSLDDCPMFTWSLGCTGFLLPMTPPSSSIALAYASAIMDNSQAYSRMHPDGTSPHQVAQRIVHAATANGIKAVLMVYIVFLVPP